MSCCKLICIPWYIILLCSDCAADQMSFCSSTQFFISIWLLCDFDVFFVSSCISYCGLWIARRRNPLPWCPSPPGGSSCSSLAVTPAWALVQSARGAGGAKLGRAAWLPQGCLLTKGWQCLGGTGACLLSLVSYKGRTWKPRCLHWTSRIQGRMRPKWIPATLTSLHDIFPPLD